VECQQKISFFPDLFCVLLSVGTFTSVFKDKESLEITKQQKSRLSLIISLIDGGFRILIRIQTKNVDPDPDPGGTKKRIRIQED
jgi:hypothetical protein